MPACTTWEVERKKTHTNIPIEFIFVPSCIQCAFSCSLRIQPAGSVERRLYLQASFRGILKGQSHQDLVLFENPMKHRADVFNFHSVTGREIAKKKY